MLGVVLRCLLYNGTDKDINTAFQDNLESEWVEVCTECSESTKESGLVSPRGSGKAS